MPFANIVLRDNGTEKFDLTLDSSVGDNLEIVAIDSAEAFGTHQIALDTVVSPTSIDSTEVFGTHQIVADVTIEITGIVSAEVVSENIFIPVDTTITFDSGIASLENVSSGLGVAGDITIMAQGVIPARAFGTPQLVYDVTLTPSEIPSNETFGNATVNSPEDIDVELVIPRRIFRKNHSNPSEIQRPYVIQVETFFWLDNNDEIYGKERRLIQESLTHGDLNVTVNFESIFTKRSRSIAEHRTNSEKIHVDISNFSIKEVLLQEKITCSLANTDTLKQQLCEINTLKINTSETEIIVEVDNAVDDVKERVKIKDLIIKESLKEDISVKVTV